MASTTNVTFQKEEEALLKAAVKHYRFESLAQYFRTCGHILFEHYVHGDSLLAPYRFETLPRNGETDKGAPEQKAGSELPW